MEALTQQAIAEFFDKDAIRVAPETLYRADTGSDRFYYTVDEKGEPFFYPSVTTMVGAYLPTSPHLMKWMREKGAEAEVIKHERAAYGTLMHIMIKDFLLFDEINMDANIADLYADFFEDGKYIKYRTQCRDEWNHQLKKDLLSFATFAKEYHVKPLAIEIPLSNKSVCAAGTLDLPCIMKVPVSGAYGAKLKSGPNKGKRKVIKTKRSMRCLVDFKSGRSGFYESHEVQLLLYRELWNKQFPDLKIKRIFNWSPAEWRTTPKYKLKDQTDSVYSAEISQMIKICKNRFAGKVPTVKVISGVLTKDSDPSTMFKSMPLADIVRQQFQSS